MDMDEPRHKPQSPMISFTDLHGYSAVYLQTATPQLLIKSSNSTPRLIPIALPAFTPLTSSTTQSSQRAIAFSTSSPDVKISFANLPNNQSYTTPLPITPIEINRTIDKIAYHPPSRYYVLATSSLDPFALPKDDPALRIAPPATEPQYPLTPTSTLSLFARSIKTIVQSIPLSPSELVLTLKILPLSTRESNLDFREEVVVVGTCVLKGEDLAATGNLYIYRIIPVAPDPDRPGTNNALKLLYKESCKGAVTALSSVGTQGFLMLSVGQKILVKGFKGEEGKELLPVAFLDTRLHTTVCKELVGPGGRGTGLVVIGDALGGLWFVGYTVCRLDIVILKRLF